MSCFYAINIKLYFASIGGFDIEISDKIQGTYTFHDTSKISQQKLETVW